MVAVADGVYSAPEYELLHQFSNALDLDTKPLKSLENSLYKPEKEKPNESAAASPLTPPPEKSKSGMDVLHPVKDWLEGMDVQDPRLAKFVCKVIPPQCPFERDINLFGRHYCSYSPSLQTQSPVRAVYNAALSLSILFSR